MTEEEDAENAARNNIICSHEGQSFVCEVCASNMLRLKRVEIAELKAELESHAWEISPAMAQAKIDQLNAEIAELQRAVIDLNFEIVDMRTQLAAAEKRGMEKAARAVCNLDLTMLAVRTIRAEYEKVKP